MRALVAPLRQATAPEPVPGPDQALVEVRHASINFSEAQGHAPAGGVLGYDAAGVVIRAASDGTGPAAGTRVVAFGPGAWAERAAFDTSAMAEVPAEVDLAHAASLPMTGLAALRSLRAAGPLPGRRVLVTGASGAVGRLAVQLAGRAGAQVIASVSDPRRAGLEGSAGVEVVAGLEGVEPVDVVIELVGGQRLVDAWALVKPGGNLQSVGWAAGEAAVFPPNSTFSLGAAKSLQSFGDTTAPGPDLAFLLGLLAKGELVTRIAWHGSWDRVDEAVGVARDRRTAGKVILDLAAEGTA
jgi:NADPH2:quinone reductase